jgi:glycosyltransferase involved in cell wall biosynthesis
MPQEKILLTGDSLQGPTGFANDGMGIAWGLAEKYEVHYLGLQSFRDEKVNINIEGIKRTVVQHANQPRTEQRWDFGKRSLPKLLDGLEPDILLSINDIQMVQHIPDTMCKSSIGIQVMDLPSKKFISDDALLKQLQGELQKFKERFPRTTKWIAYCPQDGIPPMGIWSQIYQMADQCVAMSNFGKDVFKQYYNMDVPKIWHGVDIGIFNPSTKPNNLKDIFVLGNINRNQPRKQPVRTMEAFAKFAKDKKDVALHMQMDWNDEFGWPIQYFSQLFGIQNKMIPPQRVGMPREEVSKIYNMWDLNLNCTGGEGFGLTHIEGFACGLPSLAVDYTTSKELIMDGEPSPRGSLVKPIDLLWEKLDVAAVRRSLVDIDDLVKTMNKYYYNRDLAKEHGKNANEWVRKNCSWTEIGKQWHGLVEEVLSKK